jgi:hypothetical protein
VSNRSTGQSAGSERYRDKRLSNHRCSPLNTEWIQGEQNLNASCEWCLGFCTNGAATAAIDRDRSGGRDDEEERLKGGSQARPGWSSVRLKASWAAPSPQATV